MNAQALIDTVVHQTTVLIAHLATAAGLRAPLEGLAEHVFLDLARALREQRVAHTVIADMFGMALRTYHRKMRDVAESSTARGMTLWEAVVDHVRASGPLRGVDVLRHFHLDGANTVRAVLRDAVDSGLLFRSGRGDQALYRAATEEEVSAALRTDSEESLDPVVWAVLHRFGPATASELADRMRVGEPLIADALDRLLRVGRATRTEGEGEGAHTVYRSDRFVVPLGEDAPAWAAALADHYQAIVAAICAKLRGGDYRAELRDALGGSTFDFDLWPGHPLTDEVLHHLRRVRVMTSDLRERVDAVEMPAGVDPADRFRVTFYAGQLPWGGPHTHG